MTKKKEKKNQKSNKSKLSFSLSSILLPRILSSNKQSIDEFWSFLFSSRPSSNLAKIWRKLKKMKRKKIEIEIISGNATTFFTFSFSRHRHQIFAKHEMLFGLETYKAWMLLRHSSLSDFKNRLNFFVESKIRLRRKSFQGNFKRNFNFVSEQCRAELRRQDEILK